MQFQYIHHNKTGGTTLQNLLRSVVKEGRYVDCAHTERNDLTYEKIYMKRIMHDVSWRKIPGWDPIVVSVFREPEERLFADYTMIRRWQADGIKSTAIMQQFDLHPDFESFFSSTAHIATVFKYNHYAYRLLGSKFGSWLNHRLAFHGGNLDDIDSIMDEAVLAVQKLDICLLLENFENINPILDLVAGREMHLQGHELRLNAYNSAAVFADLTPEQAGILRSCCRIDRAIYEIAEQRARQADYCVLRDKWLSEDDSLFLDIEDAIGMSNVYPRECSPPKYSVWTCTGGARISFGAKNTRNKRLFCRISNFRSREQLDEISVSVGGNMVEHVIHYIDGMYYLDALIPGDLFRDTPRRDIVIWAPAEWIGNPDDTRVLGIELSSLSIVSSAH